MEATMSKEQKYFTVGILANTHKSESSVPVAPLDGDKEWKKFEGDGAVYLDFKADNMVHDMDSDLIKLIKFVGGGPNEESGVETVAYFNKNNIIGIWDSDVLGMAPKTKG
jgi:hypothetical protein